MVNLSIIILNYNTREITISCLRSLVKQYIKELKNGQFEIIVVDNNSADESVESIKYYVSSIKYGVIKIIKNKENLGFAKGCNIGTKSARGKYILFLNSDTEVLDRGFLGMTEFLDNNQKIGILGGRLLNSDGSAQPSCGKFYTLFNLFIMLVGMERVGFLRYSPKEIKRVDWVSGGCMMVRKKIFEELEGFDEKLFMYMEDMELCYRAKKIGILTYFYPDVSVLHKTLGSSNKSFAIIHIYKGILYFYRKHKNRLQCFVVKAMLVVKAILGIVIGFLIGSLSLRETYKKALRTTNTPLPSPSPSRGEGRGEGEILARSE